MRPLWLGSLAVLAMVAAGCGESKPTLAPVRGHVYYHGVPLAGGAVVFTPDPDRGGRGPLACARIGADGAYVLVTGTDNGAVVGWHRVTFQGRAPTLRRMRFCRPTTPTRSSPANRARSRAGRATSSTFTSNSGAPPGAYATRLAKMGATRLAGSCR